MQWKLFAIAMAILFVIGFADRPRDVFDIAAVPIDLFASVGLFAYAFRFQRAQSQLWTAFAWLFAGWSIFSVVLGAMRSLERHSPVYAVIGGSVVAAALVYPNWLALRRLGRAQYAKTNSMPVDQG